MLQTAAACCGLYAYRPTRGTISRDGVTLIAGDLDAVGWICRSPALLPLVGDAFSLPGGEHQAQNKRCQDRFLIRHAHIQTTAALSNCCLAWLPGVLAEMLCAIFCYCFAVVGVVL